MIDKMNDDVRGKLISEFVGLNLKMYSLVLEDNKEIKKPKGVYENIVKNIRHK